MKRIIALLLAMSMAMSLALTGCAGGKNENTTPEAPESSAPAVDAETDTSAPQSAGTAQTLDALPSLLSLPTGDLAQLTPVDEMQTLTTEDMDRLDRAMRAYTPPETSLLVNNAESFYYYSQLPEEMHALYDVIYMAVSDPENENNICLYLSTDDPGSDAFYADVLVAYYSMLYDHPELFWLYNASETDLSWSSMGAESSGFYSVYFYLSHPVENFVEQQTAFNNAAEAFLADIDLNQDDAAVAKDIHDKLIDLVTYDMAVLEDSSNQGRNLAHTAYGALVANSDGTPNYAVCDGYSLAYEYLLQQVGIEAAFIGGKAGSSEEEAGGHAWNVIKLDDCWYEVDSTWDDYGSLEEELESIDHSTLAYQYYSEALNDSDYREMLNHYLYRVSTEEITNFVPDDTYAYITKDGLYALSLVNSSVHIRDKIENSLLGYVMEMAPIAS